MVALRFTDTRTVLVAGRRWGMGRGAPPKVARRATLGSWNDRVFRFHSVVENAVKSKDMCVTYGLAGAFARGNHSKPRTGGVPGHRVRVAH